MALSNLRFFGEPELTARSEVYDLKVRPSCGHNLEVGTFYGTARDPAAGADANTVVKDVAYFVTRIDGAPFSSSMAGASIRLKDIVINSLSYIDINGNRKSFEGPINVDFVSKIKKVVSAQVIQLEHPFTVSYYILNAAIFSEDAPYLENTQIETERFDGFNETDIYLQSANNSGTDLSTQVYNVRPILRNNYYVSNILSGTFEIIHSPRREETSFSVPTKRKCLVDLTLSNLRAYSGSLGFYKVFQQSWNVPSSPVCVAEGPVASDELLVSRASSNLDMRRMGSFYNLAHAYNYMLINGAISYTWTPDTLIDSVTVTHIGGANDGENDYIMMKDNTAEVIFRTAPYVPTIYQTSSFWYTDPSLYVNGGVEPTASYPCAVASPTLSAYGSSMEVVKSGSIYNSNSVKLSKNTMYEFSMNYANLAFTDRDLYQFVVYFVSTDNYGAVSYTRIGDLTNKTTRGFITGVYTNRFLALKSGYGTIKLVPKYITSVAISDLSLKPFHDDIYSIDSLSIKIPVQPSVQNEKVEFTIELYDVNGDLVPGASSQVASTPATFTATAAQQTTTTTSTTGMSSATPLRSSKQILFGTTF